MWLCIAHLRKKKPLVRWHDECEKTNIKHIFVIAGRRHVRLNYHLIC